MSSGLKGANLALSLLVELGVIAALAWWGWTVGATAPLKILLGTAAPLIAIGAWSVLGAPRSPRRLKGQWYWLLRVLFDTVGALALYFAGLPATALAFAAAAALNCALAYAWGQ